MKTIARLLVYSFLVIAGSVHAQDLLPATLRITVDPVATISLNHKEVRRTNDLTEKFPNGGAVVIKVAEPGYITEYRTVSLRQGYRQTESFKLKPEPVPVLFRSNTEATVLYNGSELGVTPFYHFFEEARIYRIVFRSDGYQEETFDLDLSSGNPRVITRELMSDSGTIQINTIPVGAQVKVNGVTRAETTPCTLSRIREGEHTVSIHADGYKPMRCELRVSAGETVPLNLKLERLPAGLTISTIPVKARVYVDDVFRGESDLTLSDLAEGVHQVRVVAPGYATATRSIQVTAGGKHVEEFELIVVRGTLTVQTFPAKVKVFDGKRLLGETSPATMNDFVSDISSFSLVPGEHTITFEADGYTSVSRKVTIEANKTEPLRVKLEFKPDFEVVTRMGTYRGVLIHKKEGGEIKIELKPGVYRTFLWSEVVSYKMLRD